MTGEDAQGYATAMTVLVELIFKIVTSPFGLLVLLVLGVIALCAALYRIRSKLEKSMNAKYDDLSQRLESCESEREDQRNDCTRREQESADRERKNLLAIATLHGVLCGLEANIPGHVKIPSLQELFNGKWSTAQSYNPEVVGLTGDGSVEADR